MTCPVEVPCDGNILADPVALARLGVKSVADVVAPTSSTEPESSRRAGLDVEQKESEGSKWEQQFAAAAPR